jgi:hypothetical protein
MRLHGKPTLGGSAQWEVLGGSMSTPRMELSTGCARRPHPVARDQTWLERGATAPSVGIGRLSDAER